MNKMIPKVYHYICLVALVVFASCSDDDGDNSIDVPTSYSFERNGTSSVSFSGQTTRIAMAEELADALKVSDDNATYDQLLAMYDHQEGEDNFSDAGLNASSKNLKSKTAASADYFSSNTAVSASIRSQLESYMAVQAGAVVDNRNTLAVAGTAGQIADGDDVRYVSAQGVECDQIVAKSLIGALMADQALNNYLSTAVLDAGSNRENNDAGVLEEGKNYTTMEHKWDEAYGYLYGQSQDPANPNATLGDDSFLNKYLGRVEGDEDFTGIADEIFQAFVTGRAAIVAGDYDLRDAQAEIIRENISTVIGVRAVYYLQGGKNLLNPNDMGPAFHDLSEGLGFVYSLQFTRKPGTTEPYVSKSKVDSYLGQLMGGNGLWDVTAEMLDAISNEIVAEFDFTLEEAAQ